MFIPSTYLTESSSTNNILEIEIVLAHGRYKVTRRTC